MGGIGSGRPPNTETIIKRMTPEITPIGTSMILPNYSGVQDAVLNTRTTSPLTTENIIVNNINAQNILTKTATISGATTLKGNVALGTYNLTTTGQIYGGTLVTPRINLTTANENTVGFLLDSATSSGNEFDYSIQQGSITTTNATQTVCQTISLSANYINLINVFVVGGNENGEGCGYILRGVFQYNSIIGSVGQTVVGESAAGYDATMAIGTGNVVEVKVTGIAGQTVDWYSVAHVQRIFFQSV